MAGHAHLAVNPAPCKRKTVTRRRHHPINKRHGHAQRFTAALIGLGLGTLVAMVVKSSTPIAASVPPLAVVAALGSSALTGILFGMLPALRASRLDPVAALRHE